MTIHTEMARKLTWQYTEQAHFQSFAKDDLFFRSWVRGWWCGVSIREESFLTNHDDVGKTGCIKRMSEEKIRESSAESSRDARHGERLYYSPV